MKITQRVLLGAGALVLVLTNAVVLVGVAYNRTGPADSVLALSEREIGREWSWMSREGENSGLTLRVQMRTENNPLMGDSPVWQLLADFHHWEPHWLDRDKLAALGFDVGTKLTGPGGEQHYNRMLERDVLLVLELDGPARAHALQVARDRLANLQNNGSDQQLREAQQELRAEEYSSTRLFIVDAGLDQDRLRQQYPDRTHYAIVHGRVRPSVAEVSGVARLYGIITAVNCESINVPLQLRATMPPNAKAPLAMQVAFGRRLEPWIVSAHP